MIALLASAVAGTQPSSEGIGQAAHLGFLGTQVAGARPAAIEGWPDTEAIEQTWVWAYGRGDFLRSQTALGAQVGLHYDVALGAMVSERSVPDTSPLAFVAGASLPARFYAWNTPFPGAASVHIGLETQLGGQRWWTESPTLGVTGGARVALQPVGALRVELDWTGVPWVAGNGPGELRVRHTEHRFRLTIGLGPVGVGAVAVLASESIRDDAGWVAPSRAGSARTLGALVEYRR